PRYTLFPYTTLFRSMEDNVVQNFVKEIYDPFTDQEISDKIAELLSDPEVKTEVKILYQTVENLHKACPKNLGDWYFTGDYPTFGDRKSTRLNSSHVS